MVLFSSTVLVECGGGLQLLETLLQYQKSGGFLLTKQVTPGKGHLQLESACQAEFDLPEYACYEQCCCDSGWLLRTGVASPATVKRHGRSAGKFLQCPKKDKVKVQGTRSEYDQGFNLKDKSK
ncbi:hypothetical protein BDR07DRAFT_1425333, partial [Suillus spraguei]